jgi:diacylglycerol kinase (ATP)
MPNVKILFIINPLSGNSKTDWQTIINQYFESKNFEIGFYVLGKIQNKVAIKNEIESFSPDIAVAVGGDGTINLVAELILKSEILLGIVPGGSANGLANEFGIPFAHTLALDIITKANFKKIHAININEQLCIHLSDIGINAYGMKKFRNLPIRGMWGYFIAAIKVLLQNSTMYIELNIEDKKIKTKAIMVVIANGSQYGSGAVINPLGDMQDGLFEIVVVKEISMSEIFKMRFSHTVFDPNKTEIFQTDKLTITSNKKVHFQIDGEYLGKVKNVNAELIPNAFKVIVP